MVGDSNPVAVTYTLDTAPVSSKAFLDIQTNIDCRFTLKCVRDMTRTYSQMHGTDKYNLDKWFIWNVLPVALLKRKVCFLY